jgi:hypothetical protein
VENDGYRAVGALRHHTWWVHAFRKHCIVPHQFVQIEAAAAALLPSAVILLHVPVLPGHVTAVWVASESHASIVGFADCTPSFVC